MPNLLDTHETLFKIQMSNYQHEHMDLSFNRDTTGRHGPQLEPPSLADFNFQDLWRHRMLFC